MTLTLKQLTQPVCGKQIDGPIYKDRGRSRPLWRRGCRRRVKWWGDKCWQHGGPRTTPADVAGESEES